MSHLTKRITFARGHRWQLGRASNDPITWGEFVDQFREPFVTTETTAEYHALDRRGMNELKATNGWFIGAPLQHGVRQNENVLPRDLLTLDMDCATPEDVRLINQGQHFLSQFECMVHTTRTSTPEKPKLRIIILCGRRIEAENYEAVSRIIAKFMDDSMTKCDPAGFRLAQLMYMPTVSKDQKYFFKHNEGLTLNPEWWLSQWPNWNDRTCLPKCPQEKELRVRSDKPLKNPTEYAGVFGAFCSAYGIDEAISSFIPDTFIDRIEVGGEIRYTYAGSTSQNGAVALNDLWLYSHHSTDPYSERMLNAFDLVRLHKFGALDADPSKPNRELESWKEMQRFAKTLPAVQKALVNKELDASAMFDNIETSEPAARDLAREQAWIEDRHKLTDTAREILGYEPLTKKHHLDIPPYPGSRKPKPSYADWFGALEYDKNGIKVTEANLIKILVHDERLRGSCAWNAFRQEVVYKKPIECQCEEILTPLLENERDGDLWKPIHTATVKAILTLPSGAGNVGYGMKVPDSTLRAAILVASQHFEFHPVIDHIVGLPKWDGTDRVSRLWIDHLKVPDTPYHRESARLFLTAAVARLFEPGVQFDHVPIIMGVEGIRKSTFVKVLAFGAWSAEFFAPLDNPLMIAEQLSNKWMLEMSEISSLKKSDSEHQKSFITRTHDRARFAYAERMGENPRQCVFVGTTNEYEFLIDHENRRFWPIHATADPIDTTELAAQCDQIWAQALELYLEHRRTAPRTDGMHFNLTPGAEKEAQILQDSARAQTAYDEDVGAFTDFLETPIPLSQFLGSGGFDAEVKENPMVVRCSTVAKQLATEVGDSFITDKRQLNAALQHAGKHMRRVPGWITLSQWNMLHGEPGGSGRLKISESYPRAPAYVRADASKLEINRGYRIYKPGDEVI